MITDVEEPPLNPFGEPARIVSLTAAVEVK
jgi:hypothetical protein